MTTPVSAATPARAMNPTATATDRLKPSHHISQKPPANANGTESMTMSVFGDAPEIQVEQQEYDQQSDRNNDLEAGFSPLQILELSAPGGVVPGGKFTWSATAFCASAT